MAESTEFPQNEILRLNKTNSEHLSTILKRIRAIKAQEIQQQNVDLSLKYWDELKSTKSAFKLLLDAVDSLLDTNSEWNAILIEQKEGKSLSDDKIEFISFVADEYKKYYNRDDAQMKSIEDKWRSLNEEIRQYIASKKAAGKQQSAQPHQVEEERNFCVEIMDFFAGCFRKLCCCLKSKASERKSNGNGNISEQLQVADNSYHSMDDVEDDMKLNTPLKSDVDDADEEPLPSFDKMQSFFASLMSRMKEADVEYFKDLQLAVSQVIDSFKALQSANNDAIKEIDTLQNKYNQS